MKFITDRLIIRPWEESDAKSLYEYAKDEKVGHIAGWPVHKSVEESLEIIKNVLSAKDTYAVCLKEDNIAIGSIDLISPMQSHTKMVEKEIEIGYWIGVPFWGKGYIPEGIKAIQKYVFEDLKCKAMWCGYYDGNEKSKRCQEKCGFQYHHTEINKPCVLMGDIRTEHFTYLTKEDWLINNACVKTLEKKEYKKALDLSYKVFLEYEAVNYPKEGIELFKNAINDEKFINMLTIYGAFINDEIIGVLATRNKNHIALFFVDGKYHNKGIGKKLWNYLLENNKEKEYTVNSSNYAVEVYRKLGFVQIGEKQEVDGIQFIPMKKKFSKSLALSFYTCYIDITTS